uniref:Uncharacterized protein n=1 Tax=viral metagenome TaxID=1070528 RepID=A0A6C0HX68_9ZZZZ
MSRSCDNCIYCNSTSTSSSDLNMKINTYNTKLQEMVSRIPNSNYILEMTKCCSYSEFLTINKDKSLAHLYKAVSVQFHQKVDSLYVYNINNPNDKLIIPFDAWTTMRQFISSNSAYFRPTYPLPAQVVYNIWYDDGHCHDDDSENMIISNSDVVG